MNNTVRFETSPWGQYYENETLCKYITIEITDEHVNKSMWRRFEDPISVALNEHVNNNTCVDVFWNSDGFAPYDTNDEARIGFHIEHTDGEYSYYTPLSSRAAKAMYKLRKEGRGTFKPFKTRIAVPITAL